jgi:integrase
MNAHTARARAAAKRDYLAFVGRAGTEDLTAWVQEMQSRGLAANTIRQRVYLVRGWLGIATALHLSTPRTVHERKWLDAEQVRALLAVIPRHETGRRDFALLATLMVSGQRVGQVRLWRWRDVRQKTAPKILQDIAGAIPTPGQDSYSGNMTPAVDLLPNAFLFATPERRLGLGKDRQVIAIPVVGAPVSPQEINRRIRRYARLAGLEPEGLSSESLRRTHRELGQYTVTILVEQAFESRSAKPVRWKRLERDSRLHGIGRRKG